jgi:hypothetical protein
MSSGPALPKSLAPGESFAIRLEPSATAGGDLTGILVIGDAIFPLAVDIPTLPGVRFSAAGRTLRAGEQVSLGLRLGRTYPVDISGTLQLDLESVDSVSDPSLRWSTGGQQVAFRIPAGATSAVIAGEAEMVAFHAALVPGTITVTARLAAYPWGIDITPASAPQVQFIAAGETGAMFADGFPTTRFRVPTAEGKVTVTVGRDRGTAGRDLLARGGLRGSGPRGSPPRKAEPTSRPTPPRSCCSPWRSRSCPKCCSRERGARWERRSRSSSA